MNLIFVDTKFEILMTNLGKDFFCAFCQRIEGANETILACHATDVPDLCTPTVGGACCREWGCDFQQISSGLFVNTVDKVKFCHIPDNRQNNDLKLVVSTDGQHKLGCRDMCTNGRESMQDDFKLDFYYIEYYIGLHCVILIYRLIYLLISIKAWIFALANSHLTPLVLESNHSK